MEWEWRWTIRDLKKLSKKGGRKKRDNRGEIVVLDF